MKNIIDTTIEFETGYNLINAGTDNTWHIKWNQRDEFPSLQWNDTNTNVAFFDANIDKTTVGELSSSIVYTFHTVTHDDMAAFDFRSSDTNGVDVSNACMIYQVFESSNTFRYFVIQYLIHDQSSIRFQFREVVPERAQQQETIASDLARLQESALVNNNNTSRLYARLRRNATDIVTMSQWYADNIKSTNKLKRNAHTYSVAIDKLDAVARGITGTVDTHTSAIDKLDAVARGITGTVDTHTGAIDKLDAVARGITGTVDAHISAIDKLNKRIYSIADNDTNFAKLQQDLNKNNTLVHNLQENTSTINTVIDQLKSLLPIILLLLSLLTVGNSIKIVKLTNTRIKSR